MRYENVNCIACGQTFTAEDDVVVCPVCGAPHHRACWTAAGACAKNDAHASGYTWVFPAEVLERRKAAEAAGNAKPAENVMKLKNGENVVECPNCGAVCCENDIYCLRCGMRLDGTQPYTEEGTAEDEYDERDLHAIRSDFDRFGGISPDALVDGIPCWEYAEYVGGAKPGRIIRKVSTMERFGRRTSWNWAALLFGPAWFFWRKMKKEGAIISVFLILLACLFAVVQLNDDAVAYYKKVIDVNHRTVAGEYSLSEMRELVEEYADEYLAAEQANLDPVRNMLSAGLEYCMLFGLPLICSLLSIPLYRKKVKTDIMGIRGRCSNMDDYVRTLRTEGGTSAGLCAVGVLLMLLAVLCVIYLPYFIVSVFL